MTSRGLFERLVGCAVSRLKDQSSATEIFNEHVFSAHFAARSPLVDTTALRGSTCERDSSFTSRIRALGPEMIITDYENAVPFLINAKRAAQLCGVSLRTWRTRDAAGLIPRAVRVGRSLYWKFQELNEWVTADCPPRTEWELTQRR